MFLQGKYISGCWVDTSKQSHQKKRRRRKAAALLTAYSMVWVKRSHIFCLWVLERCGSAQPLPGVLLCQEFVWKCSGLYHLQLLLLPRLCREEGWSGRVSQQWACAL